MGGCIGHREPEQKTSGRIPTDKNSPPLLSRPQPSKPPPIQPPILPPPPKTEIKRVSIKLTAAKLNFDVACFMYQSYSSGNNLLFRKKRVDWFSLPIISRVSFEEPTVITVKNCGIRFNHFVVGIILEKELREVASTPWKGEAVVCYESNSQAAGSWIRHGEQVQLPGREVGREQVLSGVIREGQIQFWINKFFQGKTKIPQHFINQTCFPYVAVFCEGDQFQIGGVCPLQPYYPPSS